MIERLDIDGVHMDVDDNTRRYVQKKIGRLDKYLPKSAKASAHAEVALMTNHDEANRNTCEVTLYLPKEVINVKESTVSIFAAIDIVEAKLTNRLKKYKDMHSPIESRYLLGR